MSKEYHKKYFQDHKSIYRERHKKIRQQEAIKKIEELERQLASSNEIREAEKKILIQEIAKNKELENRIRILNERIDDICGGR
jgi:hypothetical protein